MIGMVTQTTIRTIPMQGMDMTRISSIHSLSTWHRTIHLLTVLLRTITGSQANLRSITTGTTVKLTQSATTRYLYQATCSRKSASCRLTYQGQRTLSRWSKRRKHRDDHRKLQKLRSATPRKFHQASEDILHIVWGGRTMMESSKWCVGIKSSWCLGRHWPNGTLGSMCHLSHLK